MRFVFEDNIPHTATNTTTSTSSLAKIPGEFSVSCEDFDLSYELQKLEIAAEKIETVRAFLTRESLPAATHSHDGSQVILRAYKMK